MALSKIDAANFLTGTIPQGNVANASLGAVTALPGAIATGKVLQVVSAHTGTQATSNSQTYADTGLTASITPSSSSNKVLVLVQQSAGKHDGNTKVNIRMYRDSTEIGGVVAGRDIAETNNSNTNNVGMGFSNSYLDSPSSTSSLTYKTQFNNNDGAGTAKVQVGSGQSYITLMEIEA